MSIILLPWGTHASSAAEPVSSVIGNNSVAQRSGCTQSQLSGREASPPRYLFVNGHLISSQPRCTPQMYGVDSLAMPPPQLHPQLNRIIHKLRSQNRLRRTTFLNPFHKRSKHILLRLKWDPCCTNPTQLPQNPPPPPPNTNPPPPKPKKTPPPIPPPLNLPP